MNAIKDLMGSEKGFMGILLFIAATVFVGLGKMTIDQWQEFSLWAFGIYAGSKTVTSAVTSITSPTKASGEGEVVPEEEEEVPEVVVKPKAKK